MSTKKATTMADLMNDAGKLPIMHLRRGDVVQGTILQIDENGAVVDVGAKAEGYIPLTEVKNTNYNVGDTLYVYVATMEDRNGQLVLSIAKAKEVTNWRDLQNGFEHGTSFDATITDFNKGGFMAEILGLPGFIPFSQSESVPEDDAKSLDSGVLNDELGKMIGKTVSVRVIEIDKAKERIILSETEASLGESLEKRREMVKSLKVGAIVDGTVSAVMPYGLMIDIDGTEGLIPVEEIGWDEETSAEMLAAYEMGQEVKAEVIEIDEELGKMKLSVKKISSDPWQELESAKVGDVIKASISRMTSYGVFATVNGSVEGMIPLSSISENSDIAVGKEVDVEITHIDTKERRIDFVLKG